VSRIQATPSAIVFAYHDVGVRCLRAVLDAGVRVPLVVTHRDDPGENVWFASVSELAATYRLPCVAPDDPNAPGFVVSARERAGPIDFVFSFYYRRLLAAPWLAMAKVGAFNLHGSLLPKYRGRSPVNWAVIQGERETGATLHVMNEKPDSGAIVDQCAVPILGDDTAREVFGKVVVAAEIVLARSLPRLIDGSARFTTQDLSAGHYFGGRRPEDGRIPSHASAHQIHDLVRALAPPYPGAFVLLGGHRVFIERTQHARAPASALGSGLRLFSDGAALLLLAADGGALRVLAARREADDAVLDARGFVKRFVSNCLPVDA
jgi:methionyl-tRNA formyltransferase